MSLDDKVRDACHRIEELYYETGGKCYVSFSGGKDSTVLLALIKLCEEVYTIPVGGIPAVFSNTGIELGVTINFVKWVKENYYPNIQYVRPKVSFDWVIKEKGKPQISKIKSKELHRWREGKRTESLVSLMLDGKTLKGQKTRTTRIADKDIHFLHDSFPIRPSAYCCDYLKKKPFANYEKESGVLGAMTGIRMPEGGARAMSIGKRSSYTDKICTLTKNGIIYKMPIVDWDDSDVDEFVKAYNVPLSEAYTKYGFDRTGCMACPYAKTVDIDLRYLYFHEPNRYKAAMHWLQDVYIAQDVRLPFDQAYEAEREREWRTKYEPMRQEMLRKYRPNSHLIKDAEQTTIFEFLEQENGND